MLEGIWLYYCDNLLQIVEIFNDIKRKFMFFLEKMWYKRGY